jgi:hypothetical protein
VAPSASGKRGLYVRDLRARRTFLGSRTATGAPWPAFAYLPAMSNTGMAFVATETFTLPDGRTASFRQIEYRSF